MEGRHEEAVSGYEAIFRDPARAPGDRVTAMLRAGRCHEERKALSKAREAFESVLAEPRVAADRSRLPEPGSLDIHLRLQAEAGLERLGGDPVLFYATLCAAGDDGQRLAAIRSLGRLRDGRGRGALLAAQGEEAASAVLREAAAEALEALDRAENLGAGEGDGR